MRYKIDIFYMYVDILLDTLYILDIILNNSHRDDLVLSYLLLRKLKVMYLQCKQSSTVFTSLVSFIFIDGAGNQILLTIKIKTC